MMNMNQRLRWLSLQDIVWNNFCITSSTWDICIYNTSILVSYLDGLTSVCRGDSCLWKVTDLYRVGENITEPYSKCGLTRDLISCRNILHM